jgi:cytochrome P450
MSPIVSRSQSEAAALLFKPLNPDALVAIVDKTEHRRTRRFMSQRFSVQGIAKMEHLMQFVYKAFDRRLQRTLEKSDKARINIWDLLHCAGIDTIGETAFGQTFNSIESSHARVVELVEDTFKYISITSAFPPMRNFAFLPINKNQQKRMDEMVDICTKILKERRAKTGTDLERDDIVQLLVSGKFPDNDENLSDYLIVTNMVSKETLAFNFSRRLSFSR